MQPMNAMVPASPGGAPGPGAPAPGAPGPMMGMPSMPGMMMGAPGAPGARPMTPGAPGMNGTAPGGMQGMGGMMMPPPGMQQGMQQGMPQGMQPGMMQGGMNPMMNPMMFMMMQQQMQQMQQMQQNMRHGQLTQTMMKNAMSGSSESKSGVELPDDDEAIDPEIQELCDYFNIEDRWIKRLNETMKKRQDTKAEDIEKLYETLERARSPTGLLTVKIGEMESGRFIGKVKPDKEVERLARKFKLDDPVASRFTELIHRRKKDNEIDRMHKDLNTIEQHLKYCKRANAMATLLVGKLLEGEVDELPDLSDAEKVMEKYRLDDDAKSKLREIIEKRAEDKDEILVKIKKHLDNCANPSSMLCHLPVNHI
ncbi:unnamed protein product [Symbiodinium natans]|uniref:Uncharacterized protein n=1 Tax=Symbiodinium natans TaxID=878477 RepID=A0A812RH48_9DINO|nr:unnamed protein product [Symbiodinium natans]